MKVKVPNQFYNGKIGILKFTKGVAVVDKADENEARSTAIRFGFEIIEDSPKATETKKPAAKKTTTASKK